MSSVGNFGSVIYLTPLGSPHALENSEANPLCYLLEIDEAKILLDCGAQITGSLAFETGHLTSLSSEIIKNLDAILCTHADFECVGGLIHLCLELGATCPIYMTIAANLMTHILLSDLHSSLSDEVSEPSLSISSINAVLKKIVGIRFSQPVHLTGKASGIIITALPAGHSLGGAYWKIRKSSEDIIYAVRFNHKKERHLDGTTLISSVKPSVLIVDSSSALTVQASKKDRDETFINAIVSNLRSMHGDVLIPVSPVGRLIEILLLLESRWIKNKFHYPIYLISNKGDCLIDYVKSMLEWMSESISKSFTANRENPFEFKHIKVLPSYDAFLELESRQDGGRSRVVLASGPTLDYGPSKRFLFDWASNPAAMLVFVDSYYPSDSLAAKMLNLQRKSAATDSKGRVAHSPFELSFDVCISRPLEGNELKEWHQKHIQPEDKNPLFLDDSIDLQADFEDDEGFEDSIFAQESQKNIGTSAMSTGPFSNWLLLKQYDLLLDNPSSQYVTFPLSEKKRTYTEYGEALDPSEFPVFQFADASKNLSEHGAVINSEVQDLLGDLTGNAESSIIQEIGQDITPKSFELKSFSDKVNMSILQVSFDGLCDGKSLKSILEQIQPKKLVLIHSDAASKQYLSQSLKLASLSKNVGAVTGSILSVENNIRQNISYLTNMLQLRIHEDIFDNLAWIYKDDSKVARCKGFVHKMDGNLSILDVNFSSSKQSTATDLLRVIYTDLKSQCLKQKRVTQPHELSSFVGDSRLASLRSLLMRKQIPCRFDKGSLILLDSNIVFKKDSDASSIILESDASPEFLYIQKLAIGHFSRL